MDSRRGAAAIAAVVRLVQAFSTLTYAAPDEFWQGPEIGHMMAFDGVGFVTWEWWQGLRIRSSLHPVLQGIPLVILKSLHLCPRWMVQLAPRLLHALFAFIADLAVMRTYSHATEDSSNNYSVLWFHLFNHFSLFAGARSFSNTLEWCLFAHGLAAWTFVLKQTIAGIAKDKPFRYAGTAIACTAACAVYSIVVRPSAIVSWAAVGFSSLTLLYNARMHRAQFRDWMESCVLFALPVAVLATASTLYLDRRAYGEWVIPALSFLRFNGDARMTSLFGVHHPLWYLYAGLPMVGGTMLPWAILGLRTTKSLIIASYASIVGLGVAALSVIPHKEHRFLLPFLPVLAMLAAEGESYARKVWPHRPIQGVLRLSMLLNVCVAAYLNMFHQRGPVAMSEHIGELAGKEADAMPCPMSVHWLTPCHSAPFYSVVHHPIPMLQLDCSPSSRVQGFPSGFRAQMCAKSQGQCCMPEELPLLSESELWQQRPMDLLEALYGCIPQPPSRDVYQGTKGDLLFATRQAAWASVAAEEHSRCREWGRTESEGTFRELPSHIVMYDTDAEKEDVQAWLSEEGYRPQWSHWYSLLPPPWAWKERVARHDKLASLAQWTGVWKLLVHLEEHADRDPTSMILFAHTCVKDTTAQEAALEDEEL